MHTHGDVFDRPDRVGPSFFGSVGLHVSVAVALLGYAAVEARRKPIMGDVNGGGMGSVAVSAVKSIPLPSRNAPENPVANNTKSFVPAAPPKTKPQPKVKPPDPKAIALPDKMAPVKPVRRPETAPNKFEEKQHYTSNQLYSDAGRQVSTPMFQKEGAGGLTLGNNNPLGQQFGYYAKLIMDEVGRRWNTSTLSVQTAPVAVVTFTINRDGSVAQSSIKIAQSSGISPVDLSAERAVMDSKFPPLPQGFPRSDAQIELRFELRR